MGIILLGIACWISFTLLFSTIIKNATTCVVLLVIMWLIILPLISQIGFIAFIIGQTGGAVDKPDNVNLMISGIDGPESNDLMILSTERGSAVSGVEIEITMENGSLNTTPLAVGNTVAYMNLDPGKYSWDATMDGKAIESGTFVIDEVHGYTQTVFNQTGNKYNDIAVGVTRGIGPEPNATVILRGPDGNQVTPVKAMLGTYMYEDLEEGRYEVEISINNVVVLEDSIYSYGDYEHQGIFEVLMNPNFEYPDYVSFNYAMNPDNDMAVAVQLLEQTDDQDAPQGPLVLLEVGEGVIALVIFFLVTFILGALAFWRMELG
jgi:ABC-type transport system involved in multi-copper enzyme maturation permease subunit